MWRIRNIQFVVSRRTLSKPSCAAPCLWNGIVGGGRIGHVIGSGGGIRALSSAAESVGSVASRRLRSPVTWTSATATIGILYGIYQYQYTRQLTAQRTAGRPDLGGEFSLIDSDGRRVTSESLKGRWVLLYFGFTKCPDICPDELHKVSGVLERLEAQGKPVQPVFITIDPARDSCARLKAYFGSDEHGFHPKFTGLTGTHDEVRKACRAYRVYFSRPTDAEIKRGDYLLDHSIISYLVDPEGEFADYYGKSLSADEMYGRVAKLIGEWERQKWWDSLLPAALASPKKSDAQELAAEAAKRAKN